MILEREFSESCAADGVLKGYLSRIDEDTRLHRENELPIVGTGAIRLYLAEKITVPDWSPTEGAVSIAGDLGYTYGSYELKSQGGDSAPLEKGYYLHVWKRNRGGEWKLVADITNAISPENDK